MRTAGPCQRPAVLTQKASHRVKEDADERYPMKRTAFPELDLK